MSKRTISSTESAETVETTLNLLTTINAEESITQRNIAGRLGVALGLTNALIKRCVKKGFLKVKDVPAKRFAYYITPKGFSEKSRLTAEYLSSSLNFFRHARREYGEHLEFCKHRGWTRVAFYSISELTEIASIDISESGITPVAVIDFGKNIDQFCDIPVVQSLDALEDKVDAIILTDAVDPQKAFDTLKKKIDPDRILTPRFLHVYRDKSDDEAAE